LLTDEQTDRNKRRLSHNLLDGDN